MTLVDRVTASVCVLGLLTLGVLAVRTQEKILAAVTVQTQLLHVQTISAEVDMWKRMALEAQRQAAEGKP